MTTHDTTVRASWTSILDSIRNVNNRLALLTLKTVNKTHSHADLVEIGELHKKLDKLNKEYDAARRLLDERQKLAADNDPAMQRARANTRRV